MHFHRLSPRCVRVLCGGNKKGRPEAALKNKKPALMAGLCFVLLLSSLYRPEHNTI